MGLQVSQQTPTTGTAGVNVGAFPGFGSGGSTTTGPKVLGGYAAGGTPPRYFAGDQFKPAQLPINEVAMIQRYLVNAGLLDPSKVSAGIWNAASATAYEQVLAYANQAGVDQRGAFVAMIAANQNPNVPGGHSMIGGKDVRAISRQTASGTLTGVLPTQEVSDADLATTFRAAAIDQLGKGFNQDQINSMVQAYHDAENQAIQDAANAKVAGGAYPKLPTPSAFAEQTIQGEDPNAVSMHNIIKQGGPIDAFNTLLDQWNQS